MQLMTKELRKKIPKLYAQEKKKEKIVYAKFFDPTSQWTWYILEFDGKDQMFAYVVGLDKELGYVSLSELEGVKGKLGLGIERDIYWTPTKLSDVKKGIRT